MGIGLYVVKEIVTLHNGAVMVDSTEEGDSTFTFCLRLEGVGGAGQRGPAPV
jgi:signal transduction histidine kinase